MSPGYISCLTTRLCSKRTITPPYAIGKQTSSPVRHMNKSCNLYQDNRRIHLPEHKKAAMRPFCMAAFIPIQTAYFFLRK